MQWYHRPESYTQPNLISRPKLDLIDETKSGKPHLQAATVSDKRCGRQAMIYRISGVKKKMERKKSNLKNREVERNKERGIDMKE